MQPFWKQWIQFVLLLQGLSHVTQYGFLEQGVGVFVFSWNDSEDLMHAESECTPTVCRSPVPCYTDLEVEAHPWLLCLCAIWNKSEFQH